VKNRDFMAIFFSFFPNLKRIALVVTRDLRVTGEVDDIYIGDLNTYFDFVKFNKASEK
jgi:hypothetical protein